MRLQHSPEPETTFAAPRQADVAEARPATDTVFPQAVTRARTATKTLSLTESAGLAALVTVLSFLLEIGLSVAVTGSLDGSGQRVGHSPLLRDAVGWGIAALFAVLNGHVIARFAYPRTLVSGVVAGTAFSFLLILVQISADNPRHIAQMLPGMIAGFAGVAVTTVVVARAVQKKRDVAITKRGN